MDHHAIFESFDRVEATGTDAHMFDFLGGRTRVAYKKGWAKFATPAGKTVKVGYPPANEHYLDWITILEAVTEADGIFRMAELGAGWAPWVVRAALASNQNPKITGLELMAIEADPSHYAWALEHFTDNGLDPSEHSVLFGAVSNESGTLKFPVVDAPDVDYGSGLKHAVNAAATIDVPAFTIPDILGRFDGPLDFLHVDIQGAEYDALPPHMDLLLSQVKAIMIGTHGSDALHDTLSSQFRDAGWIEKVNYPRNSEQDTAQGVIQFYDGFLHYKNPGLR